MTLKSSLFITALICATCNCFSQEMLPQFSLVDRGDKVTISWINAYPKIIQLNAQRSYDSLRNFATIYSATSPELPQNGYTDKKPATNRVFYRIFYVLDDGSYYFTKAKRAGGGPVQQSTYEPVPSKDLISERDLTGNINTEDERFITIIVNDEILDRISARDFKGFKDSILHKTRDTIFYVNDTLVGINPFVAKENWKPSIYINVNRDGYINIAVPFIGQRKYSVKFFEENGSSLFEIHNVKESPLVLDKSIFIHSGWFLFELYEDNKLKEKNKFYLPKDF